MCARDASMLKEVISGKYRFGELMTMSAMVCIILMYVNCTVVFMSPENATSKPWCTIFEDKYVKKNLILVAVDEAHCISDWSVAMPFISLGIVQCNMLFIGVIRFVRHLRS